MLVGERRLFPATGPAPRALLFDLTDLRSPEGRVAHQALFAKDEYVHWLAEGLSVVGSACTLLHHGHRGVRADRPVAAVDELVACLRRVEEDHLAVMRQSEG